MIVTILIAILFGTFIGSMNLELSFNKVVCFYETPIQGYAAFWIIISCGITLVNPIANLLILIASLFLMKYGIYKDK